MKKRPIGQLIQPHLFTQRLRQGHVAPGGRFDNMSRKERVDVRRIADLPFAERILRQRLEPPARPPVHVCQPEEFIGRFYGALCKRGQFAPAQVRRRVELSLKHSDHLPCIAQPGLVLDRFKIRRVIDQQDDPFPWVVGEGGR
jgi:hypothetical protein